VVSKRFRWRRRRRALAGRCHYGWLCGEAWTIVRRCIRLAWLGKFAPTWRRRGSRRRRRGPRVRVERAFLAVVRRFASRATVFVSPGAWTRRRRTRRSSRAG